MVLTSRPNGSLSIISSTPTGVTRANPMDALPECCHGCVKRATEVQKVSNIMSEEQRITSVDGLHKMEQNECLQGHFAMNSSEIHSIYRLVYSRNEKQPLQ